MKRLSLLVLATVVVAGLAAMRGGEIRVPFIIEIPRPPDVATSQATTIVQVVPTRRVDPPLPTSTDGPLALKVRAASGALQQGSSGELHVLVQVDAATVESKERLPLNLALVLDRSGSMAARNKLDYAKKAAKIVVKQLTPADHVSIVAFDSASMVLLPSTPVQDTDAIMSVIDNLTPGGSTNLSQGMADAKGEIQKHLKKGQINRMLVMTDGLTNFGETNPQAISRWAQACGEEGISITTLGLGADYQEDLLLTIAEVAGGRYYFVENPDQMAGIYESELKGILKTVARNARVTVAPSGGASIDQILGYRCASEPAGSSCSLGDIFAGQSRKLIVRMRVPTGTATTIDPVVTATLTYEDAQKSAAVTTIRATGCSIVTDTARVERSVDLEVQEKVESVKAAGKLEEAMIYLDRGQREEARKVLREQARASRMINDRFHRSAALSQQVQQMEGAAQALDQIQGEAVRTYIKSNKFQAYQLSH